ncbi:DUF1493 family protein [Brenneria izadpanahii]|uniref:DUF1493 family protein n=1 Tax=Brenneria izadpanahii TaxID=2722756 RepID=A0ABX7UTC5_9GAMM|nr:DUF1493 family protein [Brenneria izadpanahii]QTF09029.1 DUF1493 family protein [Brenneria izadpanahii]
MELKDNAAEAVIKWYDEPTPFGKKRPLTLDTRLSAGKYPWARETADDLVKDYFPRFGIDDSRFDFLKYWPDEKGGCQRG